MADLTSLILQQRGDVGQKLGTGSQVVNNWWQQHGQGELMKRLQGLGRQDVLDAVKQGTTNLTDWYSQHGSKEYQNIWKSPQRLTASGVPVPAARKAFSDILPYDKVFNPTLITALAESQINPEVGRQKLQASRGLESELASSGQFRTGIAGVQRQQLSDTYERQRREQVEQFRGGIQDPLTDWYNRQYELYGKSPSAYVAPEVPSYESFIQGNPALAAAYQQQTDVPTTYQSPFLY